MSWAQDDMEAAAARVISWAERHGITGLSYLRGDPMILILSKVIDEIEGIKNAPAIAADVD